MAYATASAVGPTIVNAVAGDELKDAADQFCPTRFIKFETAGAGTGHQVCAFLQAFDGQAGLELPGASQRHVGDAGEQLCIGKDATGDLDLVLAERRRWGDVQGAIAVLFCSSRLDLMFWTLFPHLGRR